MLIVERLARGPVRANLHRAHVPEQNDCIPRMSAKCALVVDDDAPIRALLRVSLRKYGLTIDEASNGAIALDQLRANKYDIVLLDLMMPVMDGFDVLAAMERESIEVPVIVMSAASREHIQRAESPLVRLIFRKPFDLREITAHVLAECGIAVPAQLLAS
jgi:DNA-binding response OmpR family regulator